MAGPAKPDPADAETQALSWHAPPAATRCWPESGSCSPTVFRLHAARPAAAGYGVGTAVAAVLGYGRLREAPLPVPAETARENGRGTQGNTRGLAAPITVTEAVVSKSDKLKDEAEQQAREHPQGTDETDHRQGS